MQWWGGGNRTHGRECKVWSDMADEILLPVSQFPTMAKGKEKGESGILGRNAGDTRRPTPKHNAKIYPKIQAPALVRQGSGAWLFSADG